jgi:hypothetical protein
MPFAHGNAENMQQQTRVSASAASMPFQPIRSLNPYKATFTIRAKLDSKQPLKNTIIKGESTSILTLILVDAEV